MGAKRILIADGDADSRTVYRILLRHYGHEVLEVEDGGEALELARSRAFDVLITELTLRLVDGLALVEQLRQDPRTAHLCIIVLTARALDGDQRRAERAGCTRFLTKPVEPLQLLHEIEEVAR